MYNQTYDDYMRSVLGYPNVDGYRNSNLYNMPNMNSMNNMSNMGMNAMNMNNMGMMNNQEMFSDDLEHLYPEVYRVVYPMVCSTCDRIQMPATNITDEMVTRMTDDIYDRVESDPRINIEVTVTTEVRESDKRQNSSETRQRRPRNRFLRDLIRILLLRKLFRRRRFPGRFPMRPF